MSDLLIRGLEMPKNGETITITICDDGIVFEELREPGSVFKAIPVPPHGRLGDLDALAAQCDDPHWCVWLSDIEAAPTIIPAEEVEA